MIAEDEYKTIAAPAEGGSRERGSRFLAYAFPIESENEAKEHIDNLRKKYYNATHHCYAWRLGAQGQASRANDDGEPAGSAGAPILGQMLSRGITYALVVVVRYFGGTKLGIPGLIAAYREAAAEVLDVCEVVDRTVDSSFRVVFSYEQTNEVMKVVKDMQPRVSEQNFDNSSSLTLTIRQSRADELVARLEKCENVTIEKMK